MAYLPFLGNDLLWDDIQFISKNEHVKNLAIKKIFTTNTIDGAGYQSEYYRPLTTLSFATDYQIWGDNPVGFHLTSVLMHLTAGVLLFFFLKTIGLKESWSWWISLFFLIHPLQSEAVMYASSRGDPFYVLWAILGLLFFAKSFKLEKKSTFKKWLFVIISVFCYVFSILSKELGVAVGGLYFLVWFENFVQKQELKKRLNLPQLVGLVLMAGLLGFYLWLRATHLNFGNTFNSLGDATLYARSLEVRLASFSKVFLNYHRLIVLPHPLHMERTSDLIESAFSPWVGLALAVVLFFFLLGLFEFKKKKTIWIWFGYGWFISMLIPVSGIIVINDMMYGHWLYLPLVGMLIVFSRVISIFDLEKKLAFIRPMLVLFILSSLMTLLTIRQNYYWANAFRLYLYTLQYSQTSRAYHNLCIEYFWIEDYQNAIENCVQALKLSSASISSYQTLTQSYIETGEFEKALIVQRQLAKIFPDREDNRIQLIKILIINQEYEESMELINGLSDEYLHDYRTELLKLRALVGLGRIAEAKNLIIELRKDHGDVELVAKTINDIEESI